MADQLDLESRLALLWGKNVAPVIEVTYSRGYKNENCNIRWRRRTVMEITLTGQEEELIRTILDEHYRELLREIAKADHRDFRMDLREKAKRLESILSKLRVTHSSHP